MIAKMRMTAKNSAMRNVEEKVVSLLPRPKPPPDISAPIAVMTEKIAPIIKPTMIIGIAIGMRIFKKIWNVLAP